MTISQTVEHIKEMITPQVIEEYENSKIEKISDPELEAMREDLYHELCAFFGLDHQEADR